jgi:hypothetical protein
MMGDLQTPQVAVTGKTLVEPPAAITVNAAIHLMLNENTQVLIPEGSLLSRETPDPVSAGDGKGLEQTVPTFVADWAILRMVHHEPFHHLFAEIDGFLVHGGNYQAIPDLGHAAHLDPFDRAFTLHRANPASSHRSQGRVIAEAGDNDAQSFGGLNDLHPLGGIDFVTINR